MTLMEEVREYWRGICKYVWMSVLAMLCLEDEERWSEFAFSTVGRSSKLGGRSGDVESCLPHQNCRSIVRA